MKQNIMKKKYQVMWAVDTVIASAIWSDAVSPVIFTYIAAGRQERQVPPLCCNVASFGHNPAVALRTALEIVAQEEGTDMKLVDVAIEAMTTMKKYKMIVICKGHYDGGGEPIEAENAKAALAIAVESERDVIDTMRAECPEAFEVEITVTNLADEEDTASQTLAILSLAELELEEADAEDGEETIPAKAS